MGTQNYTGFNSSKLERNFLICKQVLDGESLVIVAKKVNKSRDLVWGVVHDFCKLANPTEYDNCAGSLIKLRGKKDLFLPKIEKLTEKYKG